MSWIEPVFMALVALGFGSYQIWSVNREIARDKECRNGKAVSTD